MTYMYLYNKINVCVCVCVCVFSVMSNSLLPHGPTKLLCPWNSPGKIIRVGCHFPFQGIFLTQGSKLHFCVSMITGGFFTLEPPGKSK